MKKSQRWTEKWFTLGLWLVAFIFAGFLIQLGGSLVEDLPKVENAKSVDDFIDQNALSALQLKQRAAENTLADARTKAQIAQETADRSALIYQSTKEQFTNWLETRRTTARSNQDDELVAQTKQLNSLQQAELEAQQNRQSAEEQLSLAQSTYRLEMSDIDDRTAKIRQAAYEQYDSASRWLELKVFLYRLALTMPLLIIAGWLFAKKRKNAYWPFVWGFAIFALFAFFVELVPYLPSYGGYVRAITGVILSVIIGISAIRGFHRYIERQKQIEQQPEQERRLEIEYDKATAQLAKSICPGCDRQVDMTGEHADYCPHCGLCLFNHCDHCNVRKSSFSLFCYSCGEAAAQENTKAHG
ncbi:serine endopeptidase [Bartonella sp. LJL80]